MAIDIAPFEQYALHLATTDDPTGKSMVDLYTYGIAALRHQVHQDWADHGWQMTEEFVKKYVYEAKTPIELHLRLVALVYSCQVEGNGLQETRDDIVRFRKYLPRILQALGNNGWRTDPKTTKPVLDYTAQWLEQFGATQSQIKEPGSESIVTASAPLVPYVGTCKAQFADVTIRSNLDEAIENLTETAALCQQMTAIIMDPALCIDIFDDIDRLIFVYRGDEQLLTSMVTGRTVQCRRIINVFALLLTAYRNVIAGHVDDTAELVRMLRAENILKDESQRMLRNIPTRALEADLSSFTNRVLENVEDLMGRANLTKTPKVQIGIDTEAFDLGNLRNFLRTARRYRTNQYTNQAFSGFAKVASISYVDDFVVIQPESPDGSDDQCFIPLIDDLRGGRTVFARIKRGGTDIDFFTEDQFNEIVNHLKEHEPEGKSNLLIPPEENEEDIGNGVEPKIYL